MPIYIKGTNIALKGTLETLQGVALVNGLNPDGSPAYEGTTEIFWDVQRTVTHHRRLVWLDFDFNEYPLRPDQLEEREH